MSQKGGKHAYKDRLGKGQCPRHKRRSAASANMLHHGSRHSPQPQQSLAKGGFLSFHEASRTRPTIESRKEVIKLHNSSPSGKGPVIWRAVTAADRMAWKSADASVLFPASQ